jgi:uncharacterized protein
MTLQLPERWKTILASLCQTYAPEFEVWAYGSRVTGQCHNGSDLDLVFIHPGDPDNRRCETLAQFKEALQDSHIPICVDVLDWASMPVEFRKQINSHRVKVFD